MSIYSEVRPSGSAFMIKLNTQDYADYINQGETAIIDPEKQPNQGQGVLVEIKDQRHVMYYQNTDTPYVQPIPTGSDAIPITDDIQIIGTVLWIVPEGRSGMVDI